MASLQQADILEGAKICEICTQNAAGYYCECSGAQVFICSSCFSAHSDKYPSAQHNLVRIEAADISELHARTVAFCAGKAELQQNLATLDQCCRDLTSLVESIIQMLNDYLRDQLAHLRSLKATLEADIDEAVKEVESTLTAAEVDLRGKYSACLRSHEPGSLVLFRYQLDPNLVHTYRHSLPTFSISEPAQVPLLVRLKADQLEVFDFQTESWDRSLRLSKSTSSYYSSYTSVDGSRVFCCGDRPETTASRVYADWLIDVTSGQVESLAPLSVPRLCPGVLHYQGQLFVLGRKRDADCRD